MFRWVLQKIRGQGAPKSSPAPPPAAPPKPISPLTPAPSLAGDMDVTFTQAKLWAWLDAHNIPFRDTLDDLAANFPTKPSAWAGGRTNITLGTPQPLLPDLAIPPFTYSDHSTIGLHPPRRILCYVRKAGDVQGNVDLALTALTARFGPPTASGRSNAISHEWCNPLTPMAHIRLLGFPRDDPNNQYPNSRQDLIPGSATEASIEIVTAYDPPAPQADLDILADLVPVLDETDHAHLSGFTFSTSGTGFDGPLPSGSTVPTGIWVTSGGSHFVCISRQRRFVTFTADQIETLRLDILKPAKGSGGQWLGLHLHKFGATRSISLAFQAFDGPSLTPLGTRLASKLGCALETTQMYDC